MNKLKDMKGITLIALVITIIVLIILAGVSVSLLLGNNGIITKTREGKETSMKAKYEEDISLVIADEYTEWQTSNDSEIAFIQAIKNKIESKNFDWINGEIIMCDDEFVEHQNTETDNVNKNTILLIPTKDGYEIKIRVDKNSAKASIESIEKANYEECIVTYNTNGADEGQVENQTIRSGFNVKLKSGSTLTRAGYSFAGWGETPNANASNAMQPGTRVQITGNKTYYAIWEQNTVTITYLPGVEEGYTGEMISSTPAKDSTTTLIPNVFEREGYSFAGWLDETNTPYEDEATINTTKDYTLTAQWIVAYKITYTLNGGTASNPTSYTENDEITLANPTKTAYNFIGWSGTGLTGNTNKNVTIAKGSTGARSYTANWEKSAAMVTLSNGTTATINSSNIASYIGTAVSYNTGGGTWRIFYLDVNNKYGDGKNTLFIKRDYDSAKTFDASTQTNYSNATAATWMGKLNPLWKNNDNNVNENHERRVSYLCYKENYKAYCNTSVANYAVGSPSVEMFMDAYNQWKGSTILNYKFVNGERGYSVGANGTYSNNGEYTSSGVIETGANGMFTSPSDKNIYLASPSRKLPEGQQPKIIIISGTRITTSMTGNLPICPVVSLK